MNYATPTSTIVTEAPALKPKLTWLKFRDDYIDTIAPGVLTRARRLELIKSARAHWEQLDHVEVKRGTSMPKRLIFGGN